MKKSILILVLAALCLNLVTHAQSSIPQLKNQALIGRVISAGTGEILPGATIIINVTKQIVTANEKGEFVLSLPNGSYNLSIHYLGYKTTETTVQIPKKEKFIIRMETDDKSLQEVEINAGYYTVKDKERTGSISRIEAKTIQQQPVSNPLAALIGRMAGVQVTQQTGVPGGSFSIQVRGRNSISSGNAPLYIIDGVPINSEPIASTSGTSILGYNTSPLSLINPKDIQSIEVLKDADATAIYGSRGANGVVLIKTNIAKPESTQFEFNMQQGIGQASHKLHMLNTEQYLEMRDEAFKNDAMQPGTSDYDVNGQWDKHRYTDWQKILIGGTAQTSIAQISLNGGNVNTSFRMNGGYNRETTVFPGKNAYTRKSGGLTVTHKSTNNKFNANFTANYALETNNIFSNDLTSLINLPPNTPSLYQQNGELNWENGTWNNPLAFLNRKYATATDNLITNANLSYTLVPGLLVKNSMGYTKLSRKETQVNPLSAFSPFQSYWTSENIWTDFSNSSNSNWIIEPQASWDKKFADHHINALVGASVQQNLHDSQQIKAVGFNSESLMKDLLSAGSLEAKTADLLQYRYLALFGRLNYSFRQKLFINLTARKDGSSRFGSNEQFAGFGAVGAAWLFSNEAFIARTLTFLSLGKLRLSYGTSGNDQIGDYRYLELWRTTENPYNGQASLYPTRISNPDFAWERSRKFDAALEIGLKDNRFRFSINYYSNTSSNQLVDYALPPSVGFTGVQYNLNAQVQNSGWEIEISTLNVQKTDFNWSSTLNLSIPKNKLVKFPNLKTSNYYATYQIGASLNINRVFQLNGVNPQTGLYTYLDKNGNGSIDWPEDLIAVNTDQEYYGGLGNHIRYRAFELDFMFQFVKQKGSNYKAVFYPPGFMNNQPVEVLDRWQKPGDLKDIQQFTQTYGNVFNSYYGNGSLPYSDASFVRLKSASLAYRFPERVLKSLAITQASLFISGQNLLTISSFKGLDPESQNVLTLPPLRVFTIGFQLKF